MPTLPEVSTASGAQGSQTALSRYRLTLQDLADRYNPIRTVHTEIAKYLSEFTTEFLRDDRKAGSKVNSSRMDNTGEHALDILTGGLQAGLTSPTRPWFNLLNRNPQKMKSRNVRSYCDEVKDGMRLVFKRSNFYKSTPTLYGDIAGYGTGGMFIEKDPKTIIHCTNLPIGSYLIATNENGKVDTIYRYVPHTVRQAVDRFGYKNVSRIVQNAYRAGKLNDRVMVIHAVEPNNDRDPRYLDNLNMPFRSVWFEESASENQGFLRVSGYRMFPAVVPRWYARSLEPWGVGCAHKSLPDMRELQIVGSRIRSLVDKASDPPTKGPGSLANKRVSTMAGDFTAVDGAGGPDQLTPLFEVRADMIAAVREHQYEIRQQVMDRFYASLFMLITQGDDEGEKATATEILAKEREKMLQLGPVLENVESEGLGPAVDLTFDAMDFFGLLPEAPEELEGENLEVEYISILAQAQRALEVTGIQDVSRYVLEMSEIIPDIADGFDADQALEELANMTGAPSKVIRSKDERETRRGQRRQQEQLMAMAEMAKAAGAGAGAAKQLSETPVGGDNALSAVADATAGMA